MPDITIEYATIGGARLAIVNNGNRDNNASTLFISYADTSKIVSATFDYNMVATLEGMPLSISLYTDPDVDPSAAINQIHMFYALDIIENTETEDEEWDPSGLGNIPTNPSDRTFTWNGNRLSASKKSEKYYMNIVDSGSTGNATNQVVLMGVPMAQGVQNELILNKTAYTMNDLDDTISVRIGGIPLTAGRIGNDYYLIVSPITAVQA